MGGRRKSNKIQKKVKPQTIRTIFDCALCGYKNCVIVKIKKVIKQADLNCDKCQAQFKTNIKGLDEAIDVFHKWLAELKKSKLTRDRPENRFDNLSSGDEGSQKDVEQIIKEKNPADDEQQSQFSADSLDNENNNQKNEKVKEKEKEKGKLLQRQISDDDSINEDVDGDDDIDISDSQVKQDNSFSDIDSLISDDEILDKVRKMKKH